MARELFRFKGGVHPPDHKSESNGRPIHPAPIPRQLVIPLRQHIGNPAKPVVSVGDTVRTGQLIAEADGTISAAVHASSSGTVVAIEPRTLPHASGLPDLCVVIDTDGRDEWVERAPLDYRAMPAADLRMKLRDMGLAGLGGAVFPSAVKLDAGPARVCPTLILNGGECEPWITCDDVLMRHHADDILQGVAIMRHLLGSTLVLVGIEDNKPEALAAMREAAARLDFAVEVVAVPSLYPGGGAKQMIETLTGKQVPSGKLSTDIGIQVFNVGTAHALARAVHHGEPMIERLVTVTGHVLRPQNFRVRIGTPMQALIDLAGDREGTTGVLMGGPMMGQVLPGLEAPVVKGTSGIIALTAAEAHAASERACLHCGRCVDVCPVGLVPLELAARVRAGRIDDAAELGMGDCLSCGCCAYVCPAHLPLAHLFNYAKGEIAARREAQRKAEETRKLAEARRLRLAAEAAAKAARRPARTTEKAETES